MPWYSVRAPLDALLVGHGRQVGLFHLVRYLRDGDRVFETYWTTRRGAADCPTKRAARTSRGVALAVTPSLRKTRGQ